MAEKTTRPSGVHNPESKVGMLYRGMKKARRWMTTLELSMVANICPYWNTATYLSDVRQQLRRERKECLMHKFERGDHYYKVVKV